MDTTPLDRSPLRDVHGLDTAWLARRIAEAPFVLGLGTAVVLERTVPQDVTHTTHFTAVLFDRGTGVRHIVDIKLGTADHRQIARALAFRDDSQRRLPSIPHGAAIAAEHITPVIAEAASAAEAIAPVTVLELHAERTGNIVTITGEPVAWPPPADTARRPNAPSPAP